MTPDVVVDVGNTRMKWGRCAGGRVAEMAALPLDRPAEWAQQLSVWGLTGPLLWAVASVNPPAAGRFREWAEANSDEVTQLRDHRDLPIRVDVDEPEKVGIDRLLGAVAAKAMVPPGTPAITVDVGTAVTVNLVDADGVFRGGAIFPGPRLMGRALHEHTAKLPLIDPTSQPLGEPFPPKNTAAAIRWGIDAALIGGVNTALALLAETCPARPLLYLTGGACHLLDGCGFPAAAEQRVVPTLNLEGVRIAAEALP